MAGKGLVSYSIKRLVIMVNLTVGWHPGWSHSSEGSYLCRFYLSIMTFLNLLRFSQGAVLNLRVQLSELFPKPALPFVVVWGQFKIKLIDISYHHILVYRLHSFER